MDDKASPDEPLPTRTEADGATVDLPEGMGFFTVGQVLGERYEILELLGRGGMGEVWRAFDLKLRVEVALKALREDLFQSERRLEMLRQEVRAAREVVSPNVCRIFDLHEFNGRELVSMEYVDGATLLGVLQERGPLELKEAQDIASQFLSGLEAIHKAGLVHRDVKPENIMLTRAGRVVVMDFGLARQNTEGGGSVSGTPAYMAPEQAAGQALDARADVYAAGVVLAEMVSPEGIRDLNSRQSVWEGVRSQPAKVPDTPWAAVIEKAVAKDREQRHNSAHTLTRALEDVTLRVEGAEDLHPYPGLASFTEEDAEYFFGRETEVEQMWRKLEGPPRMLALVGPSGAGKSSFIRAGLAPHAPPGWQILRSTPGNAAISSLRRVLIPEITDETEMLQRLVDADTDDEVVAAMSRWRARDDHALVVVDQFEELFTLNTPEEQHRFADLLRQLVLESDVHVLLSMRDDFAASCNAQESLRPIFHELTVLDPPKGADLRRAMTQPALQCGYRFEDDEMVDEMLDEVEGERGALPLLAFAAARLWEKRDRETGLLTRQAYQDIGGVGGALARHAESTIDRIGHEELPIVRELFRNLVTAEGTRAVREWNELTSIFRDSRSESRAEEVLRQLIEARLLTSYELREADEAPTRRIEIIHESLLANWPRLVRWQTQDADAAQLRDQLRQAARTWDEHGRTDDTLWTGAAYQEFTVWKLAYAGGLTEIEKDFAGAMDGFVKRRRRRRRLAIAAAFAALLVILAVVGSFWRRSVLETRRAEATHLLTLARELLRDGPTEALAYATASLELMDSQQARISAVRALWTGPPARVLDHQPDWATGFVTHAFSPDGKWLAIGGIGNEYVLVYGADGGRPLMLGGHTVGTAGGIGCAWTGEGLLVTGHWTEGRVRVWSMPKGTPVSTINLGGQAWWQVGEKHLLAEVDFSPLEDSSNVKLQRWALPNGEAEDLGSVDWTALGAASSCFNPNGREWIYAKGDGVYSRPLPTTDTTSDRLIARYASGDVEVGTWRRPKGFWSGDSAGAVTLWTRRQGEIFTSRTLPVPETASGLLVPDPSGRWTVRNSSSPNVGQRLLVWDRDAVSVAQPWPLTTPNFASTFTDLFDFHPAGSWIVGATSMVGRSTMWPLSTPRALEVHPGFAYVRFSPDGRYLVVSSGLKTLRLCSVPKTDVSQVVDVAIQHPTTATTGPVAAFDANGERVLLTGWGPGLRVVSLTGGEPIALVGFPPTDRITRAAGFSPSGRRVAAASRESATQPTLRVWDLETGKRWVYDQPSDPDGFSGVWANSLGFVSETVLYTSGGNGLHKWDVVTGAYEQILEPPPGGIVIMRLTADGRHMLTFKVGSDSNRLSEPVELHDLTTGEVASLEIPGTGGVALSPDGRTWVSGEEDGVVRVGRVDGGEPHLLLGHTGRVSQCEISPDSRWVATFGSQDKMLRLWPMPDLDKPPLHTLPHDELIAKLHSLTNLRAVRDEASPTGWSIEVGPFPGWAEVPEW